MRTRSDFHVPALRISSSCCSIWQAQTNVTKTHRQKTRVVWSQTAAVYMGFEPRSPADENPKQDNRTCFSITQLPRVMRNGRTSWPHLDTRVHRMIKLASLFPSSLTKNCTQSRQGRCRARRARGHPAPRRSIPKPGPGQDRDLGGEHPYNVSHCCTSSWGVCSGNFGSRLSTCHASTLKARLPWKRNTGQLGHRRSFGPSWLCFINTTSTVYRVSDPISPREGGNARHSKSLGFCGCWRRVSKIKHCVTTTDCALHARTHARTHTNTRTALYKLWWK